MHEMAIAMKINFCLRFVTLRNIYFLSGVSLNKKLLEIALIWVLMQEERDFNIVAHFFMSFY